MPPKVEFYLVGSSLFKDGHDADIVAVVDKRTFELTWGYDHQGLMDAYKEKPYSQKLERYLAANRVAGWTLSPLFKKKVDFKWILPTMLYKPNIKIELEADVTMYL